MKPINLQRIPCLVTRPAPLGEIFCKKLLCVNAKPYAFATIKIESLKFNPPNFFDFDLIIFTSPQAVYACQDLLSNNLQNVAAIGQGTARLLEDLCHIKAQHPKKDFSSEGLLAQLKVIEGQKILICQGADGRTLLKDTLSERGAKVTILDVYRRTLPIYTQNQLYDIFGNLHLSAMIVTSCESLKNLHHLLQDYRQTVLKIPLIVTSIKMLALANTLGFEHVFQADNASDEAVLNMLQQHLDQLKSLPQRNLNMDKPLDETVVVESKKLLPFKTIGICIVLAAFLAAFAAFYVATGTLIKLTRSLEKEIFTQGNTLAATSATLTTQSEKIVKLHDELSQQQTVLNTLTSAQNTKAGWQVAESFYLVKLAKNNLIFNKNISLAIKLLKSADAEIKPLEDSHLDALRAALAQDIVTLEALPSIDSEGIYVKLLAYDKLIDKLSLPNQHAQGDKVPVNASPVTAQRWWQRGWEATKLALSKIVIIRYHQSNTLPFIAPDSIALVYQNMHSLLNNALYGLLHQDAKVFSASLMTLESWLSEYFIQDDAATAMRTTIKSLSDINLNPPAPTLTSMDAFETFLKDDEKNNHTTQGQ